jgi:Protein of unknown function (DUF1360)
VPLWLLFMLMSAATFRLTRLVTRDDFPPIAWARTKIQKARPIVRTRPPVAFDPQDHGEWRWWWLGELVSCHWCVSAYLSAGVVGLSLIVTPVPAPVLWWLAVWGAAAVLTDRLG